MLYNDRLKDILRNSGIISHNDYIRKFDDNNWTDIWLNTVKKTVTQDSNYIMFVNSVKRNESIILYHPSLMTIENEIDEKMIKTNRIKGYDRKRNRVHVHYLGEGLIRIGNKSNSQLTFQLEIPTIEDLISKKNYLCRLNTLPKNERHKEVQGYLISLGLSMGYEVKVAINDRKKQYNMTTLGEIATLSIEDLYIENLSEGISKNRIDRIDVIWFDNEICKVAVAFEIEFSGNYDGVYNRLGELNKYCYDYISSVYSIVVGERNDYYNAYQYSKMEVVRQNFAHNNLCYLTIDNLAEMLILKDILGFRQQINAQRHAFFNKLYQMNNEIILLN